MKNLVGGLLTVVILVMMVGTSVEAKAPSSILYAPNIAVEEQKPVVVYSGVQNTMTFTLSNETPYMAKNLSVIPDVSMVALDGFRLMNTSFSLSDTSILARDPVTISLEAVVDDTVAEGVYPIKLLLSYDNQSRDHYDREIITYFEVREDERQKEKIVIDEANATTIEIVKGQTSTFRYKVKNGEDYTAVNVRTYISGLPENYFAVASSAVKKSLGNVARNVAKDIAIDYLVSEDVPDGSYPYKIVLEYENGQGNRVLRTKSYNLFVSGGVKGKGKLTLEGLSYPKSANQDVPFKVAFDVVNTGDVRIQDMMIRMTDNPVFIPKSASVVQVAEVSQDEVYHYSGELVATGDSLTDRNYPLEFTITYKDGKDLVTETHVMGVYINAKEKVSTERGNAPKIIISAYKSEPQIVKAGGEFDLELAFMNTNQLKTIYNVKAYITTDESTQDTGNVFTPVGSSNTFYIDEIGPKGASSQSIKLFTVPDAAPKTHTITINFEYEDKEGTTFTATEYVGIPVSQVTKVEASDFNMPSEVMVGEGVSVYFDIFNTGKAKVYNLLVKTVGDFTSDPVSRYIGNFEAGNSDYFDAYVNFQTPGLVEGKFVISYEDAVGEQYMIEQPFNVTVTEMFMPEYEGDGEFFPDEYPMPEAGIGGQLPMIIGGGLGLALVLIIIGAVVLKRRKKKKMELSFDEDE